jgi:hypothetical protein
MTEPTPPLPSEPQLEPAIEMQPQPDVQPQTTTVEATPPPAHRMPWHYYAVWVIALVSLALNVYIFYILLQVQQQAALAFSQAADSMGAIRNGSIQYVVNIDEEIPVVLDVPVNFTVKVPIQKTLPIQTTVDVPIELPLLGTRTITVPINTSIPIDLSVEVPIDESIPINAKIPVQFDVPINLKISETTFGDGLGEFQAVLQQQAESLGAGK